jgi:alpha-mannosidase
LGIPFGGPVTDKGTFKSTYGLYPHAGPWEEAGVVHQAYELNYPFTLCRTTRHGGTLPASLSFLEVSSPTVVATVLKEPERPKTDNELIVRLFETARKDTNVTITFPTKKIIDAREVDILERDLVEGRPVDIGPNNLSLEVGHDEIVTVRLEYEEEIEPPPPPPPAPSGEDGCGCSSFGQTGQESARIVYGIMFWILIVLIPLALRRRILRP